MILETLDHVVEQLQNCGIHATLDSSTIEPPCVWVTCEGIHDRTLGDGGLVDVGLHLIVMMPSSRHALTALDELRTKTDAVVGPVPSWDMDTIVVQNLNHDPLPTLVGTITLEVTE